jgi:hypothetical protein
LTDQSIYKVEVDGNLIFDNSTQKITISKNEDLGNQIERHHIKHIFYYFDSPISFINDDELKIYMINNQKKINGSLEIFIDNVLIYESQIENGIRKHETKHLSTIEKSEECTFEAVKACAIERIHNQNWFDMTLCILAGFDCVVEKYASCTVDLCLS